MCNLRSSHLGNFAYDIASLGTTQRDCPRFTKEEILMKAIYKIRVRLKLDEGGFHVWVPALPGCHSWGRTKEEALANIREAAELYLESMIAHGDPALLLAAH